MGKNRKCVTNMPISALEASRESVLGRLVRVNTALGAVCFYSSVGSLKSMFASLPVNHASKLKQ